jgi:cell division protein FtsQ
MALATKGNKGLLVLGWQPSYRPVLALVLAQRERLELGSDLRQIRFDPGGNIWLESASLGQVRLGPADGQLARRLEVLGHLQKQLPAQIKARRPPSIDLSDPEQPELARPGQAAAQPQPPS